MTGFVHKLTLTFYSSIIIIAIILLAITGYSFYHLPVGERYFHPDYNLLKPSGLVGHGLGIFGSIIMVSGIAVYMARKRLKVFSRVGKLSYWLEFHIFLCTLGPVLILFHTSFKFGGVVSIGFWSMVLVWASGVTGRFIYLQIPRSIEGRELSLTEITNLKTSLDKELADKFRINFSEIKDLKLSRMVPEFQSKQVPLKYYKKVRRLIKDEKKLTMQINHLEKMKKIFRYWHVIHLPFALVVLIIMFIHIAVVLFFGYKWIF